MNFEFYLDEFEKATKSLDNKSLEKKGIQIQVGIWLDLGCFTIAKKALD